jgi:hypothetical protein
LKVFTQMPLGGLHDPGGTDVARPDKADRLTALMDVDGFMPAVDGERNWPPQKPDAVIVQDCRDSGAV